MEGEGAAARRGAVVVGGERHRRWKIKCFAEAFESADGDKLPELRAPGGGDGDKAPEDAAAEDQVDTFDAVGDEAGERSPGGVDPHERRADEAELKLVEAKLFLEEGKDGIDRLSVGVVEKAHQPQHRHHLPAVARRVAWPGAHRLLGTLHPQSPPTTCQGPSCVKKYATATGGKKEWRPFQSRKPHPSPAASASGYDRSLAAERGRFRRERWRSTDTEGNWQAC